MSGSRCGCHEVVTFHKWAYNFVNTIHSENQSQDLQGIYNLSLNNTVSLSNNLSYYLLFVLMPEGILGISKYLWKKDMNTAFRKGKKEQQGRCAGRRRGNTQEIIR